MRHALGPATEEVEYDVHVLLLRPVAQVVGVDAAEVGRVVSAAVGDVGLQTRLVMAPADSRCRGPDGHRPLRAAEGRSQRDVTLWQSGMTGWETGANMAQLFPRENTSPMSISIHPKVIGKYAFRPHDVII